MPKNAVILGAAGQDGFYLGEACRKRGLKTISVSRSPGTDRTGNIADRAFVHKLLEVEKPDWIFHLAAVSNTRHDSLDENQAAIVTGTFNILESVHQLKLNSTVFITGSGVQFINEGKPISEKSEFEPNSAYSVARIQSVYAARYYQRLGIQTRVGYLFHHESPRRPEHHVSQKVVQAVKAIQSRKLDHLEMGDLQVTKEWTFAGDVTEAMCVLMEQDKIKEATLGSGKTYSIQDWIELCFKHAGLDWEKFVRTQSGFKSEYKKLVSDPQTIHQLGWKPQVDIAALAKMMMEA